MRALARADGHETSQTSRGAYSITSKARPTTIPTPTVARAEGRTPSAVAASPSRRRWPLARLVVHLPHGRDDVVEEAARQHVPRQPLLGRRPLLAPLGLPPMVRMCSESPDSSESPGHDRLRVVALLLLEPCPVLQERQARLPLNVEALLEGALVAPAEDGMFAVWPWPRAAGSRPPSESSRSTCASSRTTRTRRTPGGATSTRRSATACRTASSSRPAGGNRDAVERARNRSSALSLEH